MNRQKNNSPYNKSLENYVLKLPPRPSTRRRRKKRIRIRWGRFIVVVLLFFIFTSVVLGSFASVIIGKLSLIEILLTLMPTQGFSEKTCVLIMGIDATRGIKRSDTMMVIHIDPFTHQVGLLSIPRDTYVLIPGRGSDKINHAYAYGGAMLACQTTAHFLRTSVPYYVKIKIDGFAKIIDDLGGISLNVKERMYYTDYAGGLFINLKPGYQRLAGRDAIGYVRYRGSPKSDIGRIERQQTFLKAIAKEMTRGKNVLQAPTILKDIVSNIETNLNARQILGLAILLRDTYTSNEIKMGTIPGYVNIINGISYWVTEPKKVKRTVDSVFYRLEEKAPQ